MQFIYLFLKVSEEIKNQSHQTFASGLKTVSEPTGFSNELLLAIGTRGEKPDGEDKLKAQGRGQIKLRDSFSVSFQPCHVLQRPCLCYVQVWFGPCLNVYGCANKSWVNSDLWLMNKLLLKPFVKRGN